ncbi:carboxyltransferase domain-containing protein [Aneurinibacillus sp. Ricciae_BoGa-3]|uniref:5-oxoprolinase subunit B family protein n=1 Tax=Aneurinibacillus sp. Ricciae_BoGa-3 TaxID=3022697 RepID=UPI00234029D2|nr:carboxyltransferase domain-containing protein [Aneurinibacillus sp. Ricciae_BoGa-3]WCK53416.1 carboxyltransferase domain-containing protein [Aneurinibacillus sp. Ricciae_BoGa-3]
MFTLPETRFDFAGDEYIYAEISRDMSEESNFKALAITNELRRRQIPGVIDICPSNASYLIRYNPELIPARDLLEYLREIDMTKSDPSQLNLSMRIVEIPTWYDDPITREYSEKFKHRNQDPELSNFEFVMKINGYTDKEAFIEAHSAMPYLITMMGFTPGAAWQFPLGVTREKIIQAPKYISPRTDTPAQAVGVGGVFTLVYPIPGPGSYQLIGMSAVPVYKKPQIAAGKAEIFFLTRPGDIWKHRPVNEQEYNRIGEEVQRGTYQYRKKDFEFSVEEYFKKGKFYIQDLLEVF